MSEQSKPEIGAVTWMDLTVPDAETVKAFYSEVVGWRVEPVAMGSYEDYCVHAPASGAVIGGVCHARGVNANMPPQWLMYITVQNVNASAKRCVELGGSVIDGPRKLGTQLFCVLRDPAGAAVAIVEADSECGAESEENR